MRQPLSIPSNPTLSIKTASDRCLICNEPLPQVVLEHFDTRFGHPALYGIARCPACGLEQTLPRPDPESLHNYYQTYYNFGGEKNTRYANWREAFLNSFLYQAWITLDGDISFHANKGRGRLLDYGCNEGRGLVLYQKNGFDVEGLELNERAAERARSKGFKVTSTALESFHPSSPFDVIVLSNVLEHALDPGDMLMQVKRLLAPTGQVWITCPNSRSWLRQMFSRYWINWHVPFHIVHFSQGSLSQLLVRHGFEIVERRQITPALWVVQSFISRCFASPGKPTRQLHATVLVAGLMIFVRGLFFPWLWFCNLIGRGDCLVITAQQTRHQ